MYIRNTRPDDLRHLKAMYEKMGVGYEFFIPDCTSLVQVVVDENDIPVMALIGKPELNLFMLIDRDWGTPAKRSEAFREIHESMRREALSRGYTIANAWIPDELVKSFGRKLMKSFGWAQNLWVNFSLNLLKK